MKGGEGEREGSRRRGERGGGGERRRGRERGGKEGGKCSNEVKSSLISVCKWPGTF